LIVCWNLALEKALARFPLAASRQATLMRTINNEFLPNISSGFPPGIRNERSQFFAIVRPTNSIFDQEKQKVIHRKENGFGISTNPRQSKNRS
jgi:hypothetical protein